MTVDTAQVSEALQTLIDARLDTVDRMLLGRVPRQDRLAIVREVETQIFELLPSRAGEDLGREDVLAVLARLDPPEAYLPEAEEGGVAPARPAATPRPGIPRPSPVEGTRLAKAAGILGLSTMAGVFVLGPLAWMSVISDNEGLAIVLLFGTAGLIFLGSVAAITLSAFARVNGPWGVVGLVTGLIGILISVAGTAIVFL